VPMVRMNSAMSMGAAEAAAEADMRDT